MDSLMGHMDVGEVACGYWIASEDDIPEVPSEGPIQGDAAYEGAVVAVGAVAVAAYAAWASYSVVVGVEQQR